MSRKELEEVKKEIFESIKKFYRIKEEGSFEPGEDRVRYSGAVFDEKEILSMVDSILKGWWGLASKAEKFTEKLSEYLNISKSFLVNSGSSANLIALAALKSKRRENPVKKGSEVITPAVTFPTTLNPILQNNLIPKFVDAELGTYNLSVEKLKESIDRETEVIMLPHTLGNPNQMDAIMDIVKDNDLYLIEDNCDALGSSYDGKRTGSFGIMSTLSFYPAHHITTGEGGAVCISEEDVRLHRIVRSLRDWGRDCWCEYDQDSIHGSCGKRLEWDVDGIDYDHFYTYSEIGYNVKPTEIQAAMGLEQLKKLKQFNEKRKKNFRYLYEKFDSFEDYFMLPRKYEKSDPAWFAFPITLKDDVSFSRKELVKYLEENKIATRPVFGGNITRHPAYEDRKFKYSGSLKNSNKIMEDSFFVGIYPGLEKNHLDYIVNTFTSFLQEVAD
ncbi:hypothetical protein AKJ57_00420 [candidate division MSBL1 archaeon SCGC-AAA259A05]|uniref:Lipopolysaccharide biosynthesis protein RfbH n=1 Tax=candidate division MSBL1 archaeon SCGC-AAA259A05 TaxID=1698259 RepID=A0A133UBT6_9EURY|nr:hypothetical protein AKJ57_00420 [candidate division MSBL1 archaeon SCGC-AAA259A05]